MASVFAKSIAAHEAQDLLFRLMVDRAIVQAVFASNFLTTALIGIVYPAPNGAMVKPRRETTQPIFRFDPSRATSFKLGDGRAFSEGMFKSHCVHCALSFCYPDKSRVTLLELRPLDGAGRE